MNLDCEGAAYAILYGVDLADVQEICGEAHDMTIRGRRHGIDDVVASLLSLHLFWHTLDHPNYGPRKPPMARRTLQFQDDSSPAHTDRAEQRHDMSCTETLHPHAACR